MLTKNYKLLPYVMWFFPLTFFAYQFILRLWPSLLMPQIMQKFSVSAAGFGLLASLYYYGYAGMQVPVAMLLDRFGARYVVFGSALICGISILTFTFIDNWYLALLSRFLIGAGSAVGFLGTSKVVSEWFPKCHYARMIGFSFSFGLMGAIYGGQPVSHLIAKYHWQTVASGLAIVASLLAFLVILFLRAPKGHQEIIFENQFRWSHFKKLMTLPVIWWLGLANLLMVGTLEGFADVWGPNYLMAAHGIARGDAAALVSFIFVGMLFGGPILAVLSQRVGTYIVITLCGVGMVFAFAQLLFSGMGYNWYYLAMIFFAIGVCCCYQVIVFAAGADLVSHQLLGVTVAFLNCINMLGGSFFHVAIGTAMDFFWTGMRGENGLKQYTVESYHHALLVIPFCSLLGAFIVMIIGIRTKQQHKEPNNS